MEDGIIKPCVSENIFSLDEIIEAHEYYESGKAGGKKVVLKITHEHEDHESL
jgi:hypothetical protein